MQSFKFCQLTYFYQGFLTSVKKNEFLHSLHINAHKTFFKWNMIMISRNILQNMLNIMRSEPNHLNDYQGKKVKHCSCGNYNGKVKETHWRSTKKTVDLYKFIYKSTVYIYSSCRFQDFNNCRHKQLYIRGNKIAPPRGNWLVQEPQRLNQTQPWTGNFWDTSITVSSQSQWW